MSDDNGQGVDQFLGRPVTRRQVLLGAATIAGAAALGPVASACGSGSTASSASSSPAAAGKPKTGGHLRVAAGLGSAKEALDAHSTAYTMQSETMRFNIYDALLEYSPEGVLGMALAESLEPNADGTRYTAKLKPGVVFHDGTPMNADAVVYSFERIMNPKNPGLAAQQLAGLKPGGTKKVDNLTVAFELTEANAIFPEALASYGAAIVPVDYDPKGGTGAIGTGPFKLAKPSDFQPGVRCDFVANTDYWRQGGGPYVDQLSIIEFADSTAQMNALLGGAVDYVEIIPGSQRKIATAAGHVLLEAKTGSWIPFTMNVDTKPFDDVRVRQAFRLMVDRPQIIAQAEGGLGTVGNDMYGLYDPGYPKALPQRAQDLEQAKSLLKQAGQSGCTVTLVTSTSVAMDAPSLATVFAQQAKGAGVTVKIDNVTGDVFWGDRYLKWSFAQDNWGTRGYLAQAGMGTMPGSVYEETHWAKTNQTYMNLVNQAYKTVDEAKRNELITEAATIEYNEGGYIIQSFNNLVDAHSSKLMGMVADFSGITSSACCGRYRLAWFA